MIPLNAADRPWYCLDGLVDNYLDVADTGENLAMLKTIKAVQALIATVGVIYLSVVTVRAGADPTIVGVAAITVLGALNGALALDYAAVGQALIEMSKESDGGSSDESDG